MSAPFAFASTENFTVNQVVEILWEVDSTNGALVLHQHVKRKENGAFVLICEVSEKCRERLATPFHMPSFDIQSSFKDFGSDDWQHDCPIDDSYEEEFSEPLENHVLYCFEFDSDLQSLRYEWSFEVADFHPYRHFFTDSEFAVTRFSDCVIKIEEAEGREIFAHKGVLALDSPFFHSLFFGDLKVEDFLEYLYCIYPPNRPFAFCRMEAILKLADRFQNTNLLGLCEQFLRGLKFEKPNEAVQALIWANDYRMDTLFSQILSEMNIDLRATIRILQTARLSSENLKLLCA